MNTFQLSCFLAVAEYLNFSQAAQQLHVTHPAVSQQIQSLEKELEVKLFQRTTRSVRLTEEGKVFYNDAKQIVEISDRAKRRLDRSANRAIEELSIGYYNIPCMFLTTDILKILKSKRPQLHPRLRTIPFQHIYRMLEEGDLDAIVGFKEPANMKIKARYKEITKVPLMCCCPDRHPLENQAEISLEQLKGERLVLFAPSKDHVPAAQIHVQLIEEQPISDFYFCESAEAISVLVKAGYGLSVLPDFLIPDTIGITKIPIKDISPASFGVYYHSLQAPPALKDFLQCMKDFFI